MKPRRKSRRRGLTLVEVMILLGLAALLILLALMALPRQRESARTAGCRRNLMQIGTGLAIYDRVQGNLPRVGPLQEPSPSPLRSMLDAFVLPDLTQLTDVSVPKPLPGSVPGDRRVPG